MEVRPGSKKPGLTSNKNDCQGMSIFSFNSGFIVIFFFILFFFSGLSVNDWSEILR